MEGIALVGSTYRVGRKYTVRVGEFSIVTFDIAERRIANGNRRPKNLAVQICMHQVGSGYNSIWGVNNSVSTALDCLKRLGVPTQEFIDMLVEHEWDDQLPSEHQASFGI